MACRNGGRDGDEEVMILEEENERVRGFDGVLAPDRESEGDIEMGENVEGDVAMSRGLAWRGTKKVLPEVPLRHKISWGLIAVAQIAEREMNLMTNRKVKGGGI